MITKKKINIIFEESRYGGPQNHFIQINKILQNKFEINYFLNQKGALFLSKKLSNSDAKIIKIKVNQLEKNIKNFLYYLIFFITDILQIKHSLEENKADLIHVVGGVYSIKSLVASILTKRKIIWHITDTYSPILLRVLFKLLYRKCNGLIFASKKSKHYYLGKSNFKSIVIPSPINIKKKKLSYKFKNKIIIGNNCNISRVKGLDLFMQIANKFKNYKNKKIIFEIHGNVFSSQRNYFKYLKKIKKIKNIRNVIFKKKYENIENVLRRYDLYLSSSLSESSPTSLWEAMGYGVPVLSTNVGDLSNIFSGYKNIIDSNANNKTLKAIKNLLDNEKKRQKLGIYSRKYAKKNFSFKKIAKKQIMYYSTFFNN